MTPEVKAIYEAGLKDKTFLALIKADDGSDPPGMFADRVEKLFFATAYFGYILAKYGLGYKSYL